MATTPTPTQPEFIWRFYSCQKHRYLTVIATTESDARSQLTDTRCIFAARFNTSKRPEINYWYVQGGAQ